MYLKVPTALNCTYFSKTPSIVNYLHLITTLWSHTNEYRKRAKTGVTDNVISR